MYSENKTSHTLRAWSYSALKTEGKSCIFAPSLPAAKSRVVSMIICQFSTNLECFILSLLLLLLFCSARPYFTVNICPLLFFSLINILWAVANIASHLLTTRTFDKKGHSPTIVTIVLFIFHSCNSVHVHLPLPGVWTCPSCPLPVQVEVQAPVQPSVPHPPSLRVQN